jgi:hypothetical protein
MSALLRITEAQLSVRSGAAGRFGDVSGRSAMPPIATELLHYGNRRLSAIEEKKSETSK